MFALFMVSHSWTHTQQQNLFDLFSTKQYLFVIVTGLSIQLLRTV